MKMKGKARESEGVKVVMHNRMFHSIISMFTSLVKRQVVHPVTPTSQVNAWREREWKWLFWVPVVDHLWTRSLWSWKNSRHLYFWWFTGCRLSLLLPLNIPSPHDSSRFTQTIRLHSLLRKQLYYRSLFGDLQLLSSWHQKRGWIKKPNRLNPPLLHFHSFLILGHHFMFGWEISLITRKYYELIVGGRKEDCKRAAVG